MTVRAAGGTVVARSIDGALLFVLRLTHDNQIHDVHDEVRRARKLKAEQQRKNPREHQKRRPCLDEATAEARAKHGAQRKPSAMVLQLAGRLIEGASITLARSFRGDRERSRIRSHVLIRNRAAVDEEPTPGGIPNESEVSPRARSDRARRL